MSNYIGLKSGSWSVIYGGGPLIIREKIVIIFLDLVVFFSSRRLLLCLISVWLSIKIIVFLIFTGDDYTFL
jgi:uncharacterized membrane protein